MRIQNQNRRTLKGADPWDKYDGGLGFVTLLTNSLAMTVVPFVRTDFGERYLGWLNLCAAYVLLLVFILVGGIAGTFWPQFGHSDLMTLFLWAFVVLGIYHRVQITRRNNRREPWHTMYMGNSILPLPISEEKIYKFVEPLIVCLAGYFLYRVAPPVGIWLMLSGTALGINNHIVYHQERQSLLDLRDAEIEAKYLSDALSGKAASNTAGFVVGESSQKLIATDARLQTAFNNLSDELKHMIDSPPDLKSGTML